MSTKPKKLRKNWPPNPDKKSSGGKESSKSAKKTKR